MTLRSIDPTFDKIWLASFPRSGNTLLRILLKEKFGTSTCSIYEGEKFDHVPGLNELIGHVKELDQKTEHRLLIKTHESHGDDGPALYIVRDGRAALISYFHYLNDVALYPAKLEDVITGSVWPGSWSDHYRGWLPLSRPRTLVIRYEDLVATPEAVLADVAEFTGLPLRDRGRLSKSFAELHAFYPQFFRSGSNDGAFAEIEPYSGLFWDYHGSVMDELGYRR